MRFSTSDVSKIGAMNRYENEILLVAYKKSNFFLLKLLNLKALASRSEASTCLALDNNGYILERNDIYYSYNDIDITGFTYSYLVNGNRRKVSSLFFKGKKHLYSLFFYHSIFSHKETFFDYILPTLKYID